MKSDHSILTMNDCQRIFQVIHSVYQTVDNSGAVCCQFYNVAAAFILKEVYKKEVMPVMGAACFKFYSPLPVNLYFAHINGKNVSSSEEAFHCWIETEDGYVLDFTAPLYREYTKQAGNKCLIPRKMFQKKLELMSASYHELDQEGDFYVKPNLELTQSRLIECTECHNNPDLLNLCLHWFKKAPHKIDSKLLTINEMGKGVIINLNKIKILGKW